MASAAATVVKWLVIPAALAVAGVYFIGPRLGAKEFAQPIKSATEPKESASSDKTKELSTKFSSPEIDVEVGSLDRSNAEESKPKRRRRRRRKATTPASVATPTPPVDNSTSGGGDTGGDSGGSTGGGDTGGDTGGGDTGGNG